MSGEKPSFNPSMEEAPVQPVKKKSKSVIIVAIVAIAIVLAGYYYVTKSESVPWLFKGAYADYEGETTLFVIPVHMKIHLEVVDYTSTHAKLLMHTEAEALGLTTKFDNITWVDLRSGNYIISGQKPYKVYDKTIYVEGVGSRDCRVFEYHISESGILRIYVDKQTIWPLRIDYVEQDEPFAGTLTMKLIDTNIPGLKK